MKTKSKSKAKRGGGTKRTDRTKGTKTGKNKAPLLRAGLVKAPASLGGLEPKDIRQIYPTTFGLDVAALRKQDPRRYGAEVDSMAASMSVVGQLTVVLVAQDKSGSFRLVDGVKRSLACLQLKRTVRAAIYDEDPRLDDATIIANLERSGWNLMDEADHVAARVAAERKRSSGTVQDAAIYKVVGNMLARPPAWVYERVLLSTRLSGDAKKMVVDGRLPLASAKEIAKLADPTIRDRVAERSAARVGEGGVMLAPAPIERVRSYVHEHLNNLATVAWRLDMPFAGKPDCVRCPKNSANNAGLFDGEKAIDAKGGEFEITSQGVCLDPACFQHKATAIGTAMKLAVRAAEPDVAKHAAKVRPAEALAVATRVVSEVQKSHAGPTSALVPKAVADAVLAKIDRGTVKPTKEENAKDKAERTKEEAERAQRELDDTARQRLYNRRVERAEPIRKAFAQIVQSKPHMAVAALLSVMTTVMQQCSGGNPESRKKAGQSDQMTQLLAGIHANDWDGVKKVLRLVNAQLVGQYIDLHSLVSAEVEDAWAQAMDVTPPLPKAPTLQEMIDEIKAAKAGAGAAPAKGGGSDRSAEIGGAYEEE